jgi:hypothetical protein
MSEGESRVSRDEGISIISEHSASKSDGKPKNEAWDDAGLSIDEPTSTPGDSSSHKRNGPRMHDRHNASADKGHGPGMHDGCTEDEHHSSASKGHGPGMHARNHSSTDDSPNPSVDEGELVADAKKPSYDETAEISVPAGREGDSKLPRITGVVHAGDIKKDTESISAGDATPRPSHDQMLNEQAGAVDGDLHPTTTDDVSLKRLTATEDADSMLTADRDGDESAAAGDVVNISDPVSNFENKESGKGHGLGVCTDDCPDCAGMHSRHHSSGDDSPDTFADEGELEADAKKRSCDGEVAEFSVPGREGDSKLPQTTGVVYAGDAKEDTDSQPVSTGDAIPHPSHAQIFNEQAGAVDSDLHPTTTDDVRLTGTEDAGSLLTADRDEDESAAADGTMNIFEPVSNFKNEESEKGHDPGMHSGSTDDGPDSPGMSDSYYSSADDSPDPDEGELAVDAKKHSRDGEAAEISVPGREGNFKLPQSTGVVYAGDAKEDTDSQPVSTGEDATPHPSHGQLFNEQAGAVISDFYSTTTDDVSLKRLRATEDAGSLLTAVRDEDESAAGDGVVNIFEPVADKGHCPGIHDRHTDDGPDGPGMHGRYYSSEDDSPNPSAGEGKLEVNAKKHSCDGEAAEISVPGHDCDSKLPQSTGVVHAGDAKEVTDLQPVLTGEDATPHSSHAQIFNEQAGAAYSDLNLTTTDDVSLKQLTATDLEDDGSLLTAGRDEDESAAADGASNIFEPVSNEAGKKGHNVDSAVIVEPPEASSLEDLERTLSLSKSSAGVYVVGSGSLEKVRSLSFSRSSGGAHVVGTSPDPLRERGQSIIALRNREESIAALRSRGQSIAELRNRGESIAELRRRGQSIAALNIRGDSIPVLRNREVSISPERKSGGSAENKDVTIQSAVSDTENADST